eukprot:TRINITY_DN7479_c0_g1_i3.p1 TRINITY_DN7479_c0_g1~~TRINITY_DN7479_c0_g1_i3.p1  ORF type:complete len:656 (-),score=190.89 TRINITY_DN7479_c0_g1_i3:85-1917(-)
MTLTPEQCLVRWFNWHLKRANHPRVIQKLSTDLQDGENYLVLLEQTCPDVVSSGAHLEPNPEIRREIICEFAKKLGCPALVTPKDIAEGNEKLNLAFTAYLFDKFPAMQVVRDDLLVKQALTRAEELMQEQWENEKQERLAQLAKEEQKKMQQLAEKEQQFQLDRERRLLELQQEEEAMRTRLGQEEARLLQMKLQVEEEKKEKERQLVEKELSLEFEKQKISSEIQANRLDESLRRKHWDAQMKIQQLLNYEESQRQLEQAQREEERRRQYEEAERKRLEEEKVREEEERRRSEEEFRRIEETNRQAAWAEYYRQQAWDEYNQKQAKAAADAEAAARATVSQPWATNYPSVYSTNYTPPTATSPYMSQYPSYPNTSAFPATYPMPSYPSPGGGHGGYGGGHHGGQRNGGNKMVVNFFQHLHSHLFRDYILLIDKSGSMAGSLWKEAHKAVRLIAPHACACDPDGITLYFFGSRGALQKFEHIRTPEEVDNIFTTRVRTGGTTCLAGALRAAFSEHFEGRKPTTILVITDGEPDSKHDVTEEISKAANRVTSEEQLSISFIQIGHDRTATRFLMKLDDDLRTRFDIVDVVHSDMISHMSFEELMMLSLYN